ncbi:hypothetical protein K4H03_27690, partial [Mycobacterium tuberculosis]|nr:hypothetical protein [Mycobacterium tuberculosis]
MLQQPAELGGTRGIHRSFSSATGVDGGAWSSVSRPATARWKAPKAAGRADDVVGAAGVRTVAAPGRRSTSPSGWAAARVR